MTEVATILSEILKALKTGKYGDDALWRKTEVAEYLSYGLTRLDDIITLPDFPKPVKVEDSAQPRWFAGDVKAWARKRTRVEYQKRGVGRPRGGVAA